MRAFIHCYEVNIIKSKLIVLYILNILDISFTLLLLRTGLYKEINIFMIQVVHSTKGSFLLKIVVPAIILFYLYIRIKRASKTQLKISNTIINITVFFYLVINILHILWVLLIPVTQLVFKIS
ncbi:MAG: hypothetical protein K0S41_1178 [Anaerocolumna sp.]|jgi:hypothetical protein|nr:hypothetical protein [Anaerocolumna sp.]